MKSELVFIHAISPLHVGSGQGIGLVDMPIARERITNYPVIPGSGFKGCLRADNKSNTEAIFGSENADENAFAGAISVGDARIVAVPIRSLGGTFCWGTSIIALKRFKRDAEIIGIKDLPPIENIEEENISVTENTKLSIEVSGKKQVILEEQVLEPKHNKNTDEWASRISKMLWKDNKEGWQTNFAERFAILPEQSFNHIIEFGMEVVARIKIDQETGITQKGALWYEEYLPAETILSSIISATSSKQKDCKLTGDEILNIVLHKREDNFIQIGGNVTVGKGLCRLVPARNKGVENA